MDIFAFEPHPDIGRFVDVIKGRIKSGPVPQAELFLDRAMVKRIGEEYLGLSWCEPDGSRDSLKRYWDFTIEVYYRLGYDYLWVWGLPQFPSAPRTSEDSDREWAETGHGPITSFEEFEKYPWPAFTDEDMWMYEYVSSRLPEGMGMFVANGDGFLEAVSNILVGYEDMCYMMYDQLELLSATINRAGQIINDSVSRMLELPRAAGVFIGDDMGFGGGTLFSPEFLRENILPWHKKLCEKAHAMGKLYLLHSCGHIQEIMEDLINDVGIDGKHSFQENGYPIGEFKEKYGDRIALLGGVDLDMLCRLDEAALREYIRGILKKCAPGGRFAIGSGNSIADYVPLENYFILLEETRNYSLSEE